MIPAAASAQRELFRCHIGDLAEAVAFADETRERFARTGDDETFAELQPPAHAVAVLERFHARRIGLRDVDDEGVVAGRGQGEAGQQGESRQHGGILATGGRPL